MPEFIAIQCYSCEQFQVSQVKKQPKFTCKICGKKQSIRSVRGKSEKASQVRKLVQQLNLTRGTAAEQYEHQKLEQSQISSQHQVEEQNQNSDVQTPILPATSRWKKYQESVGNTSDITSINAEHNLLNHDHVDATFLTSMPDEQYKHTKRKRLDKVQSISSTKKRKSSTGDMNQPAVETTSASFKTGINSTNRIDGYENRDHSRVSRQRSKNVASGSYTQNSRWGSFQSTNDQSNNILPMVEEASTNFALTTMDGDQVVEEEVDT